MLKSITFQYLCSCTNWEIFHHGERFCSITSLVHNKIIEATEAYKTMSTATANNQVLSLDVSRAPSTVKQDDPAMVLFDHYLVNVAGFVSLNEMARDDINEDVEGLLTGYSLWL